MARFKSITQKTGSNQSGQASYTTYNVSTNGEYIDMLSGLNLEDQLRLGAKAHYSKVTSSVNSQTQRENVTIIDIYLKAPYTGEQDKFIDNNWNTTDINNFLYKTITIIDDKVNGEDSYTTQDITIKFFTAYNQSEPTSTKTVQIKQHLVNPVQYEYSEVLS